MSTTEKDYMDELQSKFIRTMKKSDIDISIFYDPISFFSNINIHAIRNVHADENVGNMNFADILQRVRDHVSVLEISEEIFDMNRIDHEIVRKIPKICSILNDCHTSNTTYNVSSIEYILVVAAILSSYGLYVRETSFMNVSSVNSMISEQYVLDVFNKETCAWEILHHECHDNNMEERIFCHGMTSLDLITNFTCKERKNIMPCILVSRFMSIGSCCVINLARTNMKKRFHNYLEKNIVEIINTHYRDPVILGWHEGNLLALPQITDGFEFDDLYPELMDELSCTWE